MATNVSMQADASSALAAFAPSSAPASACSRAIGADGMQQILQSLQAPSVDEGLASIAFSFRLTVVVLPMQRSWP